MGIEGLGNTPSKKGEELDTRWLDLVEREVKPESLSGAANLPSPNAGMETVNADAQSSPEGEVMAAEEALGASRDRLNRAMLPKEGGAFVAPSPQGSQNSYEKAKEFWAKAKLRAATAFVGLSGATITGMGALMYVKSSAERIANSGITLDDAAQRAQAHAVQVMELINSAGVPGMEAALGATLAIPALMLGFAKLKERSMAREA